MLPTGRKLRGGPGSPDDEKWRGQASGPDLEPPQDEEIEGRDTRPGVKA